jgi:hypothetical protein
MRHEPEVVEDSRAKIVNQVASGGECPIEQGVDALFHSVRVRLQ